MGVSEHKGTTHFLSPLIVKEPGSDFGFGLRPPFVIRPSFKKFRKKSWLFVQKVVFQIFEDGLATKLSMPKSIKK